MEGEHSRFTVATAGLSKHFNGNTALEHLNLMIPQGIVFGLLGPNGSGKTTFLKLLMGQLQPTAGHGSCLGLDICTQSLEIRQQTTYLGEDLQLYTYMKVEDFVQFCQGLYPRWNSTLLEHYRREFGIPYGKRINELSFGMRTQLALLVSLAPEPELLLLDEPLAGLDPLFRQRFFNTVLAETIARGKTVIIASHQLNEVERIADRVAFLYKGRLLKESTLEELKAANRVIRVAFLEEPPPSFWQMEEINGLVRRDNTFQFNVTANFETVYQKCREIPHSRLESMSKNLEEIFLSLLQEKIREESHHG